jgi:hypothetical protein
MRLPLTFILMAVSIVSAATFDEVLDRTSKAAEREAAFLASVACTENLVETKLDAKNRSESKSSRLFDYFVLVDTAEGDLSVNESRIEQGKGKTNKQLLQSTGFATLALIFHPFFQQSFTMTDGGMETSEGKAWRKVWFQYRSGKRSPTLLRTGAREYPISWVGEAWVDEQTGRVGRIQARAAAQLDEIGIKSMGANVNYGPAENLGETAGWVPLEATLDLQTAHQHWRNTHTFSRFRKFEVTTLEQKAAKPK